MSVFGYGLGAVRTVGDLKKVVGGKENPDSTFWFSLNERDGPGLFCGVPYDSSEWPPRKKHRRGDLRKFLDQYSDDQPCAIVRRRSDGEIVVRVQFGPV